MATVRQYAYYIKGNQVGIVEKDSRFDNDISSKDYGPGSNQIDWKSPLASIADGLEVQYVYSPKYFINETNKRDVQLDSYKCSAGYLVLEDAGNNDYSASPESLSVGSYIVLNQAGRWNGLHKVKALSAGEITTYTKYSGSTTSVNFEEVVQMYYDINVLNDEDDDIDLPDYLSRALVNYVKARMMEDQLNLEGKEYFMREFKQMIEKYNNTRVAGMRMISPGAHAIR
jgi:hypothetical protein